MLEAAGGPSKLNEVQLWHGTPVLANIVAITKEGFDCRLSNMGGALGHGAYFASKGACGALDSPNHRLFALTGA